MMARVSVRPAELPAAWTTRPNIIHSGRVATAAMRLPTQKSEVPIRISGRLPKRSESGPYAGIITAIVAKARLTSVCAAASDMRKSRRTNGTAGVRI